MRFFDLQKIFFFFVMIGPGVISAIAGNDAGGIATYSVAGAHFGYGLLWTLFPLMILLIIIQEMCARMGIVTGKGLADLIRENFGVRMTVLLMSGLFLANIATTVSEFAGIAAAAELFGLSKPVVVVGAALFVIFLIIRVKYSMLERVFLGMCFFYLTYVISGILAEPDWNVVGNAILSLPFSFDSQYLVLLIGIIGTTITPWMQFYLQASIVEKGVKLQEYYYAKWELILGCFVTCAIAFFIMVASAATLFPHGIVVETAAEAAGALAPFAGQLASTLFAIGLFAAALFGAFIVPLSTAYYVCEAFGWESGVNKKFSEARIFYSIIGVLIVPAVLLVLLPDISYISIMIFAQVINGIMLPAVLVSLVYLVNKKKIMGEHVNSGWYNVLCYGAIVLLSFATLAMVAVTMLELF